MAIARRYLKLDSTQFSLHVGDNEGTRNKLVPHPKCGTSVSLLDQHLKSQQLKHFQFLLASTS